jgi:16S rRNA processing protein RimM
MGDEAMFLVGKVVGVHGLKGELKIKPASNNPALALSIEDVEVRPFKGTSFKAKVQSIELEKRMLFLTLQGVDDRTAAERLVHSSIFTPRSQLEELEEDEWWSKDLIGLDAYTTDGELIGTICDIVGESGEFLEIRKNDASAEDTVLVPFVKPLVPVVSISKRRVEIVNLPGLLD